mmetsp:Transcript_15270/g.20151  ORF Transcript_15270/g.20151 Transcript_15270/m.20151 type:complete len:577 (-) Transcript_15270:155-1885(-)
MRVNRFQRDYKKNKAPIIKCTTIVQCAMFCLMAVSFLLATSMLIHMKQKLGKQEIVGENSQNSNGNADIKNFIKQNIRPGKTNDNKNKNDEKKEIDIDSVVEKMKAEIQEVAAEVSRLKEDTSRLHDKNIERDNAHHRHQHQIEEVKTKSEMNKKESKIDVRLNEEANMVSKSDISSQERVKLWSEPQTDVCGTYFGNGFAEKHEYCSGSGDLECLWNGRTNSAVCKATNILVDSSKITVSYGGEDIESVLGRVEDVEFASYKKGAFSSQCTRSSRSFVKEKLPFHLHKMLSSFETTSNLQCDVWEEKPTLFVTRYEYANLYHTMTDWYNAYQTQRMFNLDEVGVVFFDGHSAGAMDDGWVQLFGKDVKYIKHIQKKKTCYREAYFVPAGYLGALAVKSMTAAVKKCTRTKWMLDFSRSFVKSFGLSQDRQAHQQKKLLIIFRRDYRAHPRVSKPTARKIKNEDAILKALRNEFPNAIVDYATFETMTMREQIAKIIDTDVLIGIHGAGLTHILFATQHTSMVELFPTGFESRRHFDYFSSYMGIKHLEIKWHAPGKDNFDLPQQQVIQKVREALS